MTSLLDKFFAPIGKPSASSGAAGSAHAGVELDRLDYSILPPFPDDDSPDGADAWDTVWISEIPLPPVGTGQATIKTPIKIKIDKATKTGAAKPKSKITGGEAIEGTIKVRFVQEALPAMVAAAHTLYPGAGPFPIRHPKATMARLTHIQISGWGDAPDPDEHGIFEWTINYLEVSIAAQNGTGKGGAAKTPKVAKTFIQPGDTDGDGNALDVNGNVIPGGTTSKIGSNGNTVGGFIADTTAKKDAAKAGAAP